MINKIRLIKFESSKKTMYQVLSEYASYKIAVVKDLRIRALLVIFGMRKHLRPEADMFDLKNSTENDSI